MKMLLLLLFVTLGGQCQTPSPGAPPAVADTTQLGEVSRLGQLFQLPALPTLLDQRHVRLFTAGKVLDFWQSQAGVYQGQVVQWAREVVPVNEAETKREFVLTQLLDPPTVQALFAVLDSCQILRVPDERALKGWQRAFFDGVSYTLEYQDAQTHRVARYNNPASQQGLPEAQLVVYFIQRLSTLSQLPRLAQQFENAVPYETFTDGSGLASMRVNSYAQHLAYQRDRQRYRRQQARRAAHRKD